MTLQGLLDLADSLGKESAPVCALSYSGEGSKMIDQCEVQDDRGVWHSPAWVCTSSATIMCVQSLK